MLKLILPVIALVVGNLLAPDSLDGIQAKESDSIARFAPEDCFAAAIVDIDSLMNSENYRNLPFDILIPTEISLDRFSQAPIKELAVFVTDGAQLDGDYRFEVCAVASLSDPGNPEEIIRKAWQTIPQRFSRDELPISKVILDGTTVYQVPTGTFLNSRSKTGKLSFTGRDGSPQEEGFNIGNVDAMSYVPGGSHATGIATFTGVKPDLLINNQLQLVVQSNVFRTSQVKGESTEFRVYLRNPKSGLATDPINPEIYSFQSSPIAFPRKLFTTNSDGKIEEIDLFDDIVVEGQLDVVFKPILETCYLGLDENSVSINSNESEFIVFDGECMLVASSIQRLQSMLRQDVDRSHLMTANDASEEFSLLAKIQTVRQRDSFDNLLSAMSLGQFSEMLPDNFELAVGVDVDDGEYKAQLKLDDSQMAKSMADTIESRLNSSVAPAKAHWIDRLRMVDSVDQIRSYSQLADQGSFPPREIKEQNFEQLGQAQIQSWFDDFNVTAEKNEVTVDFRNSTPLSNKSEFDQWFLTSLELDRMYYFHDQKQFELSDTIHSRVTARHPNNLEAWLRRAHQVAYNTSFEMDGEDERYRWVRRGIKVLLDGAEKNPESMEYIYKTALVVGTKIRGSFERVDYSKLFSKDKNLHQRLATHIDLAATLDWTGQVDSWLVSKALFNRCIAMHIDEGKPTTKSYFFLFSRPARAHAGYARSLDERGEFELAAKEWSKAKELYLEFGERELVGWGDVRLNHLEKDSANLDSNTKEAIDQLSPHFQGWLWRAKFEQTKNGRSIRRLYSQFSKLEKDKKVPQAAAKLLAAMHMIVDEYESHVDGPNEAFRAYTDIIEAYQRRSGEHKSEEPSFATFIEAYNKFKANSFDFYFWY